MNSENRSGETARTSSLNRRSFLRRAGAGAATVAAVTAIGLPALEGTAFGQESDKGGSPALRRRKAAYANRVAMAKLARQRPFVESVANGDETAIANYAASYSKGLPHNDLGEVDPAAYQKLLAAAGSGSADDFAAVPIGGTVRLENPQAGLAFDIQGADAQSLHLPPAPAFSSARQAAEMTELYWMALARDVPFADFGSDATIAAAAAELSRLSDYPGPKDGGAVTPGTAFRGSLAGDEIGPFVSQFLVRDVARYGAQSVSAKIRVPVPGVDYMTSWADWLAIQRGTVAPAMQFDPTPRYIHSMRDLAEYAHNDALFQPYFNTVLLLGGMKAPIDPGLPPRSSSNQTGFVEFGGPHVLSLLGEVSVRALKAVWYQKWFVHRRLRPEAFGARVHNKKTGAADYPIHADVLDSEAASRVFAANGTYLLPMAVSEGSPMHPSYGQGHASVAGACATILKAFYDESFVIPNTVEPSRDGLALAPYAGEALTVGGELNKLASNIGTARNMCGVHWHSDYFESLKLGEEVAYCVLQEQKACHNQSFTWSYTKFDGTPVSL